MTGRCYFFVGGRDAGDSYISRNFIIPGWVDILGDVMAGFYALLLLLAGKSLILQESIDKIA